LGEGREGTSPIPWTATDAESEKYHYFKYMTMRRGTNNYGDWFSIEIKAKI